MADAAPDCELSGTTDHVSALLSIRESCELIRAVMSAADQGTVQQVMMKQVSSPQLFGNVRRAQLRTLLTDSPKRLEHRVGHAMVLADLCMIGLMWECALARCNVLFGKSRGERLLLKQHWAPFCKVVRNALLHDRIVTMKRDANAVQWRGLSIDPTMDGRPLRRVDFFDHRAVDQMAQDIIDSAWQDYGDRSGSLSGPLF